MATSLALAQADASRVPDFVEPLEAWRVWRLCRREGRVTLQSAFADAPWEPGIPLSATCPKRHRSVWRPWRTETERHEAPDIACSCGIYGVRSLAAARWYLESQGVLRFTDRVIGRVALWGDVVVSEGGWRASFAYPIEIFVPVPMLARRDQWRRTRLALDDLVLELEHYGVPVDVLHTDAALAV
jgi:hypothetical protein